MRLIPLICALLYTSAFAALPELPGCEARPEVNKKLTVDLGYRQLGKLKWNDRLALEDSVTTALTVQYPREIEPHLHQIRNIKWTNPSRFPQILAKYRDMAAAHPDDPFALALAATALFEVNTPESLRLAEAARAKAPQFPYPALFLALAYSEGQRVDKPKFAENLRAYFAFCPASTDSTAHWLLSKLGDNALQATIAKSLRTTLAKETDRTRLEHYTTLWALEFRTTPPSGHDALRKQVASDLKRIESLKAKLEAPDTRLLLSGYKQSGASKETITAFEDRILEELPSSEEAYGVHHERWK